MRTGLALVTGDVVVVQDGDLEYRPEEYPAVLEPLLKGECEVVFGSRTLASTSFSSRRKISTATCASESEKPP